MLIINVDNVFCVRYKLDWSQHGSLRDATIHLIAGSVLTVVDKRLRSTTEIRLEPQKAVHVTLNHRDRTVRSMLWSTVPNAALRSNNNNKSNT